MPESDITGKLEAFLNALADIDLPDEVQEGQDEQSPQAPESGISKEANEAAHASLRPDDDYEPQLLEDADAAFFVLVTKDAGDSGGAAAECTWTYTVKELDDSTVLEKNVAGDAATGMTPQVPRLHYVAYWYAGETRTDVSPLVATSRLALACRLSTADKPVTGDLGGDLRLLICFGEMPKSSGCVT